MTKALPKGSRGTPWKSRDTVDSYDLGVLFWVHLEHPDTATRDEAGSLINELESSAKPWHTEDEIRDVLCRENGTTLDPFRLSREELDLAVHFVRIALSKRYAQESVRIVPSTSIGVAGGLEISKKLRTSYFPRSLLEGSQRTPWKQWYFAPRELTQGKRAPFEVHEGQCGCENASLVLLEVPLNRKWARTWTRQRLQEGLRAARQKSTLGELKLTKLSVNIEAKGRPIKNWKPVHTQDPNKPKWRYNPSPIDGIKVSVDTPESMIQATAAITKSRRLEILAHTVDPDPGFIIAALIPDPLPEEKTSVPFLVVTDSIPDPRGVLADISVSPPPSFVASVQPHIGVPRPWLTQEALEQILETV